MLSGFRRLVLFCSLAAFEANGQACTEPGDPVALIDFGSETKAFSATGKLGPAYDTTNEACTPERTIALRQSAFFCRDDWQVLASDHTDGDEGGRFLMVNAVEGFSEVFRDSVVGLCPGTEFHLQAWIINFSLSTACNGTAADPELQFTLTDEAGNKLTETTTGPLSETQRPEWIPFRLRFRSPASGSVILRISSLNAMSCGSDFGIDDISFALCKRAIQTSVSGLANVPVQICPENEQPYLLQSHFTGFSNPAVQWQVDEGGGGWRDILGATNTNFLRSPTGSGTFGYRIKLLENGHPGCRYFSEPVQITIHPVPFAQGTNYVYGCYGFPMKLQASGGATYEWKGPSGFYSKEQAPEIPKLDFSHTGRYVVKVTSSAGCSAYDSTDMVVYEAPVASLNIMDTAICFGDSVLLEASAAPHYQWQPGIGLSNDTLSRIFASPTQTTRYTVRLFKEPTCFDTASVTIRVLPRPKAFAGPDLFALKNRMVQLQGAVSGDDALTYIWTPGNGLNNPHSLQPQARVAQTTVFRLAATAGNGCGTAYDEVKIEVVEGFYIPTAFSPNGDWLNDTWEIVGLAEYPGAWVRVFNRWGQLVYQSRGSLYQPWNGKQNGSVVVPGVYIYQLDLGNGTKVQKGTLTVLQ